MKRKKRQRKGFRYPSGTWGSLKGDPMACFSWWLRQWSKSRSARRAYYKSLLELVDYPEETEPVSANTVLNKIVDRWSR